MSICFAAVPGSALRVPQRIWRSTHNYHLVWYCIVTRRSMALKSCDGHSCRQHSVSCVQPPRLTAEMW